MTIKTMVENVKDEIVVNEKTISSSNLIEPTEAMVRNVIQKYVDGEDLNLIKKSVKKKGTNLTLSFNQINEIINEYKISLLPEVEEVVKEEPVEEI
jgi:hypothetical protein